MRVNFSRSLSVYILMFGVSAGPFFDASASSSHVKEERKVKYLAGTFHPRNCMKYLKVWRKLIWFILLTLTVFYVKCIGYLFLFSWTDKPLHNCSLNAAAIRAEVASLRSDFNRRLKQALFASSGNAYVCGIAPIIFVPQHLHFNVPWVLQYVVFFWLGRMSSYFAHAYPVRYQFSICI